MFSLSSSRTARPLLVLALLVSLSSASTCYYPDGSTAPDSPCTNSTTSACCAADAYCLDNGLCLTGMILSRGSCTDPTWKAAECASYCQDVNPSGGKGMAPCSATLWTCDYQTCALDNFTLPAGNLLLRDYQASSLGVAVAASTITVLPTAASSTSTSTSTGSTSTSTSSTSTSTNTSLLPLSTPPTLPPSQSTAPPPSAAASGPPPSTTCVPPPTGPTSGATVIAVGVGVGAPMGLALAALLWMVCRERKRNARGERAREVSLTKEEASLGRGEMGRWEIGGRTTVAELRGWGVGWELDGGGVGRDWGGEGGDAIVRAGREDVLVRCD
ncbi:hypothetical protein MMC15_007081 [Xylographa vitiligo]|nr:hypothetical protein [Xylographa vitiligo]